MKTDTLKLKAVLVAAILACANPATIPAAIPDTSIVNLNEKAFIESMFKEIEESVEAIIDLVEDFIKKDNPESFSAYIMRCQQRMSLIENKILIPLNAKLQEIAKSYANSNYHGILKITYDLANKMAYNELKTLHTILENHKKSPDAKKALALVSSLKPHLIKLTSADTLDKLDTELTKIHNLLIKDLNTEIAQKIDKLKTMVKDIKIKTSTIQNKVNIELLPIIAARLKKL